MYKNTIKHTIYIEEFRRNLLNGILLSAFFFGTMIATLGAFKILPLDRTYLILLYGYSFINFLAYYLLKLNRLNYMTVVHIATLSSLVTFTVMTITATHDEFRLVWFFLTSFASFILGGVDSMGFLLL